MPRRATCDMAQATTAVPARGLLAGPLQMQGREISMRSSRPALGCISSTVTAIECGSSSRTPARRPLG